MLAEDLTQKGLTWWPELEMGWYPVTESPYDAAYFAKYRRMDETDAGAALTRERVNLVRRHHRDGKCCDVGIGGGRFVIKSGAQGFDINQEAVSWLKKCGFFSDPYREEFDTLTFWDSLEHIPDIQGVLARAGKFVFVSIPIFDGPEHILRSKHFRKNEHFWYFTRRGFIDFMVREGFAPLEISLMEQDIGREDIESFAFVRRAA